MPCRFQVRCSDPKGTGIAIPLISLGVSRSGFLFREQDFHCTVYHGIDLVRVLDALQNTEYAWDVIFVRLITS